MRLLPRCCRKIQAGHGIVGFGLWGFLYNRRNWLFGKFQLAIFMRAGINPAPTRLEVFVGMGFIPIRKRAITGVFRISRNQNFAFAFIPSDAGVGRTQGSPLRWNDRIDFMVIRFLPVTHFVHCKWLQARHSGKRRSPGSF